MELAPTDWIMTLGELYGHPFASRCLLYRFYDQDCSLLVYHDRNITSGDPVKSETTAGSGTMFASCHRPPATIDIHYANSSSIGLDQLLKFPSTHLEYSKLLSATYKFENIELQLTPCSLQLRQMFHHSPWGDERIMCGISGTSYSLTGEGLLYPMGQSLPALDTQHLRISVRCVDTNTLYDEHSPSVWTLMAFNADEDWQPKYELQLSRQT